jgi:hypothetical protein
MPHHVVAIVLALVCASLCAQSTWIVDDDGGAGVHFTSLPAAVGAAANGDTLLVAPGHYEPFHVTGKALTIRGDGPATTFVDGSQGAALADYVSIANPPVGAVFRLSGLRLRHPLPAFTIAYRARLALLGGGVATSGSVVVHDVVAEGVTGLGWFGGLGLRVEGIVPMSRGANSARWSGTKATLPSAIPAAGSAAGRCSSPTTARSAVATRRRPG